MKKNKNEIKLSELIDKTPEEREEILYGKNDRRDFLRNSALATMGLFLGSKVAFAEKIPKGHIPATLYSGEEGTGFPVGKNKEMVVLTDKPWNVEAPPHLLDDAITPKEKMFMRNNGLIPESVDVENWTLTIDGESVKAPKTYTLKELKAKFPQFTQQVTLECAGNNRWEFNPPAKGAQWTTGAVHCAEWTGIRLKDVLNDVGIKSDAVFVGYYGIDKHISKDPKKHPISRGVPIEKALKDEVMLAFQTNGEDIPLYHGAPLRLVVPGWLASASGKWLNRLSIRNKVHDGTKMLTSYRIPKEPVEPGTTIPPEDMKMIEVMPVKSLISYPKTGAMIKKGNVLNLRGKAWAGEQYVTKVEISIDYGSTWTNGNVKPAPNMGAWQIWDAKINFPSTGYFEIFVRATDNNGVGQPMLVSNWNDGGYLNNACHRIAMKVV